MVEKQSSGISKIKIEDKDSERGFYTLLTNGSVTCLKDNKYIVPDYCLAILKKEGIDFKLD